MSAPHEHNRVQEGVRWEIWEVEPGWTNEWEQYAEGDRLEDALYYAAMLEHDQWRLIKVTREIVDPARAAGVSPVPDTGGYDAVMDLNEPAATGTDNTFITAAGATADPGWHKYAASSFFRDGCDRCGLPRSAGIHQREGE